MFCFYSVLKQAVISGHNNKYIAGIGFDATCSLVAIDQNDQPLTISTTGQSNQNIILWMDHRARIESTIINATKHDILKYVGGHISLEMEIPKIMWLKTHLGDQFWNKLGKLFDLPDFLTFKCTGNDTRSLCSLVCKCSYDGFTNSWPTGFLDQIGLHDLCKNDFQIIGKNVATPGSPIGNGLTVKAAKELGLCAGTPVATSMIDAHAGALCLLNCYSESISDDISEKMALICGTSSCHMSIEKEIIWAEGRFYSRCCQGVVFRKHVYDQCFFCVFIDEVFGVHIRMSCFRTSICTKVAKAVLAFY